MGASSRKENNDRSRQTFKEATSIYEANKNPNALETQMTGLAANPYSDKETQDMRARNQGIIRSAYAGSGRELDRAKALGGDTGSTNYIAAMAKNNRNRTQALTEGTTNVNADLAEKNFAGKMQAGGLASNITGQRQNTGLSAIGAQQAAPPIKGLPWAQIANTAAQVGMGLATGGGSVAAGGVKKKIANKALGGG